MRTRNRRSPRPTGRRHGKLRRVERRIAKLSDELSALQGMREHLERELERERR